METSRDDTTLQPIYDGVGNRVAQTVGATTTTFALDIGIGLPEVIASQVTTTSEGNSYLHLPGVIMAESAAGEVRYLLSDGLGSVRQAVDENAQVVVYRCYPFAWEGRNKGNKVEKGCQNRKERHKHSNLS